LGHLKGQRAYRHQPTKNHSPSDEEHNHRWGYGSIKKGFIKALPTRLLLKRATPKTPATPSAPASVGVNQPANNPPIDMEKITKTYPSPPRSATSLSGQDALDPAGPSSGLRKISIAIVATA